MGHSVIVCEQCGALIIEGKTGIWECDECGWSCKAQYLEKEGEHNE